MAGRSLFSVDASSLPGKKKKIVHRLQKKLEAIGKLSSGASLKEVANEYGVSVSTAYHWKHRQEKIKSFCSRILSLDALQQKTGSQPPALNTLDGRLFSWYKHALDSDKYVNTEILQKEAKRINYELTGVDNFAASPRWIQKWKSRHCIFGKLFKRNEADSSRREASVSPKKREGKVSGGAILIIDDSCDSLEPAAVDTLLYDDVVFEEPKPSSGFEGYAERAVDPLQQSPHSTPLRIREGTPQELARPKLSPDKLSPSSPNPQQPLARLPSVGETSFERKLSETTEKRRSIEEERIHSNSISDSVSSEVTEESGDEVTPNRICQETQTEYDEDQAFLDSVLPKMKKLASSDKAMLKAQILQLIKWKTKE